MHHTPRSTLKATWREKRQRYTAIGSIPIRRPEGTVERVHKELGLGVDGNTRARAEARTKELAEEFEARCRALRRPLTFAEAFINYVRIGRRPVPKQARRIVEELGDLDCTQIDDSHMLVAQERIFGADAKPGYVNRHLHTPVIAVLNMAAPITGKRATLTRPRGMDLSLCLGCLMRTGTQRFCLTCQLIYLHSC